MIAQTRAGARLVIGKNSALWKVLNENGAMEQHGFVAVGHRDVAGLESLQDCVVWIFSYSRLPAENQALFETLKSRGAKSVVYLSTATANVAGKTRCYGYPSAKRQAEILAQKILDAKILRIGMIYRDSDVLPAGKTAATFIPDLATYMSATSWRDMAALENFFTCKAKPFASRLEKNAFAFYGGLMKAAGAWPCILRPVDVLCRMLGWRWYGYLYMSNTLWYSTTSSSAQG